MLKTLLCDNLIISHLFLYTLFFLTSSHSAYLSPLLRAMPMSFSMPPASLRALVFSMFLVMTSCSAQQIAVIVSSDMVFPTKLLVLPPPPPPVLLLLLLPPGKRCTRSLMAYLPVGKSDRGGVSEVEWCRLKVERRTQGGNRDERKKIELLYRCVLSFYHRHSIFFSFFLVTLPIRRRNCQCVIYYYITAPLSIMFSALIHHFCASLSQSALFLLLPYKPYKSQKNKPNVATPDKLQPGWVAVRQWCWLGHVI